MRLPLFGFALLVFALLAVVLAVGVFFAFKSGKEGQTKLGGCAGCAVGFALLLIAGLGALGLLIVSIASVPNEIVRNGPVRSFEFTWDERAESQSSADSETARVVPALPDSQESEKNDADARPVRLRIVLRGGADPGEVVRWLRRRTQSEARIEVSDARDERGEPISVVEIVVPLSARQRAELSALRRDLEDDLPELRLPRGAKIELRGPDE